MTVVPALRKNTGGYTLIEAIVALGVFVMITVFSVNLLSIVSKVCTKLTVEAELLENARIAIDVITAYVREAEAIKLTADTKTNTLRELVVYVRKPIGVREYKFTYNGSLSHGQTRYHRIDFGGNELASHIGNVMMTIDDNTLRIVIKTDRNIDSGFPEVARQLELRASVSLKYKEIK